MIRKLRIMLVDYAASLREPIQNFCKHRLLTCWIAQEPYCEVFNSNLQRKHGFSKSEPNRLCSAFILL